MMYDPTQTPIEPEEAALLDKMQAEQAEYRRKLLRRKPSSILKCAEEFALRERIVTYVEEYGASKERAEALLKLDCPVAEILSDMGWYKESMEEDLENTIYKGMEDAANNVMRKEFLRSKGWPVTD